MLKSTSRVDLATGRATSRLAMQRGIGTRSGCSSLLVGTVLICLTVTDASGAILRYRVIPLQFPVPQYVYRPPTAIPGGMPSPELLEFGVVGEFSVDYQGGMGSARFIDVDLTLTGNEIVQNSPPPGALVTSDRLAEWLEARTMHQVISATIVAIYEDVHLPGLRLRSDLNLPYIEYTNFDFLFPPDEDVAFQLRAVLVPEPSGLAAVAVCTGSWILRRRSVSSSKATSERRPGCRFMTRRRDADRCG